MGFERLRRWVVLDGRLEWHRPCLVQTTTRSIATPMSLLLYFRTPVPVTSGPGDGKVWSKEREGSITEDLQSLFEFLFRSPRYSVVSPTFILLLGRESTSSTLLRGDGDSRRMWLTIIIWSVSRKWSVNLKDITSKLKLDRNLLIRFYT